MAGCASLSYIAILSGNYWNSFLCVFLNLRIISFMLAAQKKYCYLIMSDCISFDIILSL